MRMVVLAVGLVVVAGCSSAPKSPGERSSSAGSTPGAGPSPMDIASPSRTLGPLGIGSLRLGMTRQEAEATGMVPPFQADGQGNCVWTSHLTEAVSADSLAGTVLESPRLGIAAIFAYGTVGTPEQIRLGTSAADATGAYPGARLDGSADHGYLYASVPGNADAWYRVEFQAGKVTEIVLQLNNQDCFELPTF